MVTRAFAGAFLTCGDKMLLLRRNMDKARSPGMWAGVAGHVEPHEWNDPQAACYREIQEEAGIAKEDIHDLRLRYVITGREEDGALYTVCYFTGRLDRECSLPDCDEGELRWIPIDELPPAPMWPPLEQALRHWLGDPQGEGVSLCAVSPVRDQMIWAQV